MDDDALMVVHGTEILAKAAGRAVARRAREMPRKPGRSVMVDAMGSFMKVSRGGGGDSRRGGSDGGGKQRQRLFKDL